MHRVEQVWITDHVQRPGPGWAAAAAALAVQAEHCFIGMSPHRPAGKVCAEYIWIGGTEQDLRCKTKVLSKVPKSVEDLPKWNYDGSSCGQAPGATLRHHRWVAACQLRTCRKMHAWLWALHLWCVLSS